MTKKILYIFFAMLSLNVKAQEELVFSSPDDISRIYKLGDILYYAVGDSGSVNFPNGYVNFIDLNDPSLTPQTLTSSLNNPAGMTHKDGFLYVSEFGANRVIKLDLTQTNPLPIEVFEIGTPTNDLLFIDDILYFSANAAEVIGSYDIILNPDLPDVVFETSAGAVGI